jgi:glycosyltransferase involved in cell wall biosynthesis
MAITVSVIIPNYNHAAYLRQRIDSVLNQTYSDFEIIILDDHSTDNSKEIIESYRNNQKISHIVYNNINCGTPFKQWNKGVELAGGEYIWIAESDDKADPRFLAALVPKLIGDTKVGIAYCQSYQMNDQDEITGNWQHHTESFVSKEKFYNDFHMSGPEYIANYLIHKNTIPNASAVVFKKEFFKVVGGADETIKNNSDWFAWLKILMVSDVIYIKDTLNYYRHHDQSVIAKAVREMSDSYNFEINGGVMREKVRQYINDKPVTPHFKKIKKINDSYLVEENSKEGLYLLYKKQWVKGWLKVLASSIANARLHYIISAVKLTLKQGSYNV